MEAKYFEKCRELKMEMVTKISSVLGDKKVSLEEEDFNVIVTERHCGESWTVKISSINSYGFIAEGEEYTLSEMSMMDLACILDYLISGEW